MDVLAILHTFFDERDPEFVRGLYHLACGGGLSEDSGALGGGGGRRALMP